MTNKSSNLAALWFIPLVAVLLAVFCTVLFVAGKYIYKGVHKAAPVKTAKVAPAAAPVVPLAEPEEETVSLPPEVEEEPTYTEVETQEENTPAPEVCPATAMPLKVQKSGRKNPAAQYEQGLRACLKEGIFPCAWEDTSRKMLRQYWLMSAEGPVQRGIYDKNGNLVHETIATLNGTVTSYTEKDITYYFEGGVLVKIRTSPYENCNFHDWFFINEQGKQDVCQCTYNQADCCARSPYQENAPRTYCEMYPLDKDFCK